MTDLKAVELNINACIFKMNKMYTVLGFSLVTFDESRLIEAYGRVVGLISSLDTFKKLHHNDIDIYIYNNVDDAIISVFFAELNQARNSIFFLYDKKYSAPTNE